MDTSKINNVHKEKRFVQSTKICLVQQNFSFKHGSEETLYELSKKYTVDMFFFKIPARKFCIVSKKHRIPN